jgi:tetratricopeptide (TPR) repeat protein
MRSSRIPQLSVAALLILCFGTAAYLEPLFQSWPGSRTQNADVLGVVLGDGRRLFARHFYVKADAYFHSGYYPTVFDNREAFETPHMAEDSGSVASSNQGDETGFLGKPRDWIDALGRNMMPATHTHLDEGGALKDLGDSSGVREILPWLQLSAELDPNEVQTYTVTAYWLRERMNKPVEAEQFLREGLRANPGSYEILFELGRLFAENHHDVARARNLWQAALHNWEQQESGKSDKDIDYFLFLEITSRLAKLEESQGNYAQALNYMEMWKSKSPSPEAIQKYMDEVRKKAALKAAK